MDSNSRHKKARRFLPSAAPTIPTGGKGYSTRGSIVDLPCTGNVQTRTHGRVNISKKSAKRCRRTAICRPPDPVRGMDWRATIAGSDPVGTGRYMQNDEYGRRQVVRQSGD